MIHKQNVVEVRLLLVCDLSLRLCAMLLCVRLMLSSLQVTSESMRSAERRPLLGVLYDEVCDRLRCASLIFF